jgi:hypothetical protein
MMTDCRWWLSLLSNSRDMNCQDWNDWQWADAAIAEDAIWQSFSGFADVIMWIDIKFCLILKILSSFSFELNFRRWDLNTRKNVSFIVCEFVDEFSSVLRRHSYARRWSIKFWLKSLSINASTRILSAEITKIIDAHKWKFLFTHFRVVNTWIMSIDLCLFSTACRCRHCDIETCSVSTCHTCSR